MLKILFQIDIPKTGRIAYDDKKMEEYNIWLDDSTEFPIKKAKYSQLLYENDYDEYESRYSDEFLKTDETEGEVEEEPIETEIPEKVVVEVEKPKDEMHLLTVNS